MTPELHALHVAAGLRAGRDRTCAKKIAYSSEDSATDAANAMNIKPTTRNVLEAYPCAFCKTWHIGRKMSDEELHAIAYAQLSTDATDDELEQQRRRAVLAAFQTGRPVFADSEGELHYADGDQEPVAADLGVSKQPVLQATSVGATGRATDRIARAAHRAFVAQAAAALVSAGCGFFYHPLMFVCAAAFGWSAMGFRRFSRVRSRQERLR